MSGWRSTSSINSLPAVSAARAQKTDQQQTDTSAARVEHPSWSFTQRPARRQLTSINRRRSTASYRRPAGTRVASSIFGIPGSKNPSRRFISGRTRTSSRAVAITSYPRYIHSP